MSFKENKYAVIKNAIGLELSDFLFNYLKVRKKATEILFAKNFISPFEFSFGWFGDPQVPNTFSIYGDTTMDTLLSSVKSTVDSHTNLNLIETYSYTRLYKKGDVLERHKDRKSCEVSGTINLGGDNWPIYLEPSGKENMKGIEINLKPGDMLIYSGCELEHWRNKFEGEVCGQVFLHYNKEDDKDNKKYDDRIALGLPDYTKNVN